MCLESTTFNGALEHPTNKLASKSLQAVSVQLMAVLQTAEAR
jgi:hypothetical protein